MSFMSVFLKICLFYVSMASISSVSYILGELPTLTYSTDNIFFIPCLSFTVANTLFSSISCSFISFQYLVFIEEDSNFSTSVILAISNCDSRAVTSITIRFIDCGTYNCGLWQLLAVYAFFFYFLTVS